MVKITQLEADYLIKQLPNRKTTKASERKKHGGKTYYILNDDVDSLKVIAMLRGYVPEKQLVIGDNGKQREIARSPVQQLLTEN